MDFIKCYLCGGLAVQESVTRDLTVTVFCTNKTCGRYDIEQPVLQTLLAGGRLEQSEEEITSRVYAANREGERILITADDLKRNSEPTTPKRSCVPSQSD